MRTCCAAILAAMLVAPALAEPVTTETVKTYPVRGKTPAEIRADMNRERVKPNAVGAAFDAVTRWNVRWRFSVTRSDTGCAISAVQTTVEVAITMPDMVGSADADVLARFRRYYDSLLEHERGHGQIGVEAAREIEAALPTLPPAPTCPQAGEAAGAHARSLIAKARERGKAYDEETRHGLTQGARFP